MRTIVGRKGGKQKQHTPVETPDSLQSLATARILLLLGEGEFAGGITGKDIYLDGTPILDASGNENFPGVKWDFRPGTPDQSYIPGVPDVQNEVSQNVIITDSKPWVYTVTDPAVTAFKVRMGVNSLMTQKDNGDVDGAKVEYEVTITPQNGNEISKLKGAFSGKASSPYERTHRVTLPATGHPFVINVKRLTPDSTNLRIQDTMQVLGMTEVIDAKLRYPNSALLFVTFNAKQFSNIPQVSVKARGRIIRVPDNYDPSSRTYSGAWTGGFKWAYSNNPAWVFYDVLLNEQFGLGDRLTASQVDKWELYRIGTYCDELVDAVEDGKRVKQPRFLCDVYIQNQNEAFNVLRDLAAIFRGMTYWAQNQLFAISDMPMDRVYTYTRANVVNGKFTYAGGSERNRFSSALVSWSNPANHYADEVEIVAENDLIARYGIRQTQISAIGCTRQAEANRRGRWALLTNAKDRMVTFSTGLDGFIPLPGYIIGVQDAMMAGKSMGGRIVSANGRQITLDRPTDARVNDRLFVNLPAHINATTVDASRNQSEARTISAIDATRKIITVSSNYSQTPEPEAIWSVDSTRLAIQQFRVTSVVDNDDGTFTISAVFHNPDKYAYIDSGARIVNPPISAISAGTVQAPRNVVIEGRSKVYQGHSIATMRVSWSAVAGAVAYEAQWQKDNGEWINIPRQAQTSFEVEGIYAGDYIVQVRAIDIADISSQWTRTPPTALLGKYGKPPAPVNFTASKNAPYAINLNWGFVAGSEDGQYTEIRLATTPLNANAQPADYEALQLLSDVPYPSKDYSHVGLGAGVNFWYTARLIDRIGNKSDWTPFVQGESSSAVVDYLKEIDNAIKQSTAWDQLTQQINAIDLDVGSTIERDFRIALADFDNYYEDRKDQDQAHAMIQKVSQTVADNEQAVALEIERLTTSFGDNKALIEAETKARTTAVDSVATQLTNLQTSVNKDVKAQIQTEITARTTADTALGTRIDKVETSVNTQTASIATLTKTVSDNKTAQADLINQVSAKAGTTATTVQQHTSAISGINGKLSGQWGVKIDKTTKAGTTMVAGLQLGVDGSNGTASGQQSQFIVMASQFAVYDPASKNALPVFAIDATKKSTIINAAIIGDATITFAKISDSLQSTNYSAGKTGWRLSKGGGFELNATTAGKGTVLIKDGLITIKDAAGKTRVQMGLW